MGRVAIRAGVVQVVVAGVMLTLPTAGGFTTTSSQSRDIAGQITCRRFLKYIKRSCMSWRRDVTRVELSFHRDIVSKFRANRYLFLFLKTACLANTSFLVFDLTQSGLDPMIFHTGNEHANNDNTDAVPMKHDLTLLCENLDLFHQLFHELQGLP
jgi:hypothetical protein